MSETEGSQDKVMMMVSTEYSFILARDLDLPSAMHYAMDVQKRDPVTWPVLGRMPGQITPPYILPCVMGVFWKGLMTDRAEWYVADRTDLCLYGRDINATDWAVIQLVRGPRFVPSHMLAMYVARDGARDEFIKEDIKCRLEEHMFGDTCSITIEPNGAGTVNTGGSGSDQRPRPSEGDMEGDAEALREPPLQGLQALCGQAHQGVRGVA